MTARWLMVISLVVSYLLGAYPLAEASASVPRRVNAPYFEGNVRFSETAIFWFGRVNYMENYADVRVGYNGDHLYLRLAAFDRRLWYDPSPSPDDLTDWDAVTLYLNVGGSAGDAPGANAYRFDAQLNWWEPRDGFQAAYRGNGSGWVSAAIPFTADSGWRGNAPNDDTDDRGWAMAFRIPFSSLGLSGPPSKGTIWRMAVVLHDRDDREGTPIADQTWPEGADGMRPSTWGQLVFGLPGYTRPPAIARDVVTIRHKLNGATVVDGAVGGGTTCGQGLNYWTQWGDANYAGLDYFNIQNQADVADWPCFSKYYVTFPLDAIPSGKVIISATLTLHKFGHAGESAQPQPSLIQVLRVADDWDESTLTWNNAPLALENVSATWVDPVAFSGWPGTPFTWDVSRAVALAYAAGTPLRLALYEADAAYHRGKYFVSSDAGDWNAEGRPTLRVRWGDRVGGLRKSVSSSVAAPGEALTYTLTVEGNGRSLSLVDELPEGVSRPFSSSPGLIYTPHRLTWSGRPALGERIVLTYAVTVTASSDTTLWNRAVLTQGSGVIGTAAAKVTVVAASPSQTFLPVILRR